MQEKYCQSCAMPMQATEDYGSEADEALSTDYCKYCYDKGAFTQDCTMEEMIEFCVPHMAGANSGISEEKAREMMQEFFPSLKRWR